MTLEGADDHTVHEAIERSNTTTDTGISANLAVTHQLHEIGEQVGDYILRLRPNNLPLEICMIEEIKINTDQIL
jgi:hypothetical protein